MRTLPAFGMGCGTLGNLYRAITDDEAIATVLTATRAGIGYFDTSPFYGFGLSERRLGAALAQWWGPKPMLSTKVGRLLRPTDAGGTREGFVDADPFTAIFDYSHDAVMESFEGSLDRLGVERVDILLAHDLGAMTHGTDAPHLTDQFVRSGYEAMRALKRAGRIDAVGIGVNEIAICETLLDRLQLDIILLAGRYTLLEQGALALLDRCAALGVRVIIGGPYNSGLLVESIENEVPHYNYEAAPAATIERARQLRHCCERHDVTLPAAALRFPGAHRAVACVVAGLASSDQVEEMRNWQTYSIPNALWRDLRESALIVPNAPLPISAA